MFTAVLPFFLGVCTSGSIAQPGGELNFDRIKVNPNEMPIAFDLRATNLLSKVRTQPTGGCWSSSVMATVEPWMRRAGYGDPSFSDRNLQLTHGFDNSRNTYGNHYMATAYFSRGSGPVEQDAGMDSVALYRPRIPYILGNARYLPGDPLLIKETVMDFGPVYSMLYFKRREVDTINHVLHQPDNPLQLINHAVTLVGWNDTLPTPEGRGVWIAQNSLGKKFGEDGFFYIPYENTDILKHNAVWTSWVPFAGDHKICYHDTLGSFNSYGFNDSLCYGLVKFATERESTIVGLASYINNPGTSLHFEVYSDFNEETRSLSGKIGETATYRCVFPGYYTLDLPATVSLAAGETFYILAKYVAPGTTEPLPVEDPIKDYSNPHITSGTCWVNPDAEKWPDAWYPCGTGSPYPALYFDLCVRVILSTEKK